MNAGQAVLFGLLVGMFGLPVIVPIENHHALTQAMIVVAAVVAASSDD